MTDTEMTTGTSVQAGLSGMGRESAQIKTFEEFTTAPVIEDFDKDIIRIS